MAIVGDSLAVAICLYNLWIDSNYCARKTVFKANCLKGRVHLRLKECEFG